jgi:hypothetical protein
LALKKGQRITSGGQFVKSNGSPSRLVPDPDNDLFDYHFRPLSSEQSRRCRSGQRQELLRVLIPPVRQ